MINVDFSDFLNYFAFPLVEGLAFWFGVFCAFLALVEFQFPFLQTLSKDLLNLSWALFRPSFGH